MPCRILPKLCDTYILNEEKVNTFSAFALRLVQSRRVELHVQCILTERLLLTFIAVTELVKDSFEIFMAGIWASSFYFHFSDGSSDV